MRIQLAVAGFFREDRRTDGKTQRERDRETENQRTDKRNLGEVNNHFSQPCELTQSSAVQRDVM